MSNEGKLLLVAFAFLLPVAVLVGVYVFRDAKRWGMEAGRWTAMAVLVPGLVGFICYLLERGRHARQEGQPRDHGFWVVLTALFLVPLVLVMYSNLDIFAGTGDTWFHSRYDLDGGLRSGFLEERELADGGWYGYTHTDYMTGTTVTVERTQKGYTVNGEFRSSSSGGGVHHLSPGQAVSSDLYLERSSSGGITRGEYYHDETGKLSELVLSEIADYAGRGEEFLRLAFIWEDGALAQQRLTRPDGTSLVRTYGENGTETRDDSGTLVEYTVISGASEARYDAEGNLLDTTVTARTEEGVVRSIEVYDPAGTLLSRTEFDYDQIGFLLRPGNLAILALFWMGLLALVAALLRPDEPGTETIPAGEL